jgi:hypothetical protein
VNDWLDKLQTVRKGRSPAHVLRLACRALCFAPRTIVEVGVYEGANARRLRHIFKPERMWLVDPWAVTKTTGRYNEKYLGAGAWDALFEKICKEFALPQVQVCRALSEQAAPMIEDESIDLVYIDGDHRLEFIRRDIELWLPKIRKGGILAGHDFSGISRRNTHNRVREAVLERFGWASVWVGRHRVWLHVKGAR